MKREQKGLTRREFIRGVTGAALIGSAGISTACQRFQPAPEETPRGQNGASSRDGNRARVVLVRDQLVLESNGRPNPEILARMLDDAVGALLEMSPEEAWAKLIKPGDIVGIKTNVWRFLPTPKELEDAIQQRVMEVGVSADRISADDRGVRSNPVFQKATALINVRPMRTHHWAGVGSCIKNYIVFSTVPFTWHTDSCANLGGLWDMPMVKGKTRLNVLVMLTPLFHGKGPHHFNAKYLWEYKGLIAGTDPVAVDATGVAILQAKRKAFFGRDEPLEVSPKHIRVAEQKYKLGVADSSRIEVIRLGWMDGALI